MTWLLVVPVLSVWQDVQSYSYCRSLDLSLALFVLSSTASLETFRLLPFASLDVR